VVFKRPGHTNPIGSRAAARWGSPSPARFAPAPERAFLIAALWLRPLEICLDWISTGRSGNPAAPAKIAGRVRERAWPLHDQTAIFEFWLQVPEWRFSSVRAPNSGGADLKLHHLLAASSELK
jgi:hypothetical protein